MDIVIRQEGPGDHKVVYDLVEKAFKGAEYTDGNEQNLVEALRRGRAFVPELSLVAEVEKEVTGPILFTEARIGKDTLLVLAPVSVLPEYQEKRIGGRLIEEGHRIARELGYRGVVLLGYPAYYSKFGYLPSVTYGIKSPFEVPEEYFMAVELRKGSLKDIEGILEFPEEFGI